MSDNTMYKGEFDEQFEDEFDELFGDDLKAAFESMVPSAQAEDRMLAALQAAAEAHEASGQAEEQVATPVEPTIHAAPKKRVIPLRRWAIPAAAGLALVAVLAGGVTLLSNGTASQPATTIATTQSSQANQTTPKADASRRELAAEAGAVDGYADVAASGMVAAGEYGSTSDAIDLDYPWPDFNTEEYAALVEGGFISTKARPLSTLSADVDTASFCNLRRMLNHGYAADDISAGAVRIEEMLNYFTYDYHTPTSATGFASTVQLAQCPWNSDTQLLVLGFSTPTEAAQEREGANLVFLIDVSGSMNGNEKLGLLQDAFAELTAQLTANDVVSIVTYSGSEEVVLDGASGADARNIQRAIDKLRASGSTNGEAGLRMAYDLAKKHYIEGGVNRIIMASDGDLNVGMTSTSELYDFVDEQRKSGVYLSVLGFGSGNYKDTKMETLADHGNGQYHYIDCIDEAKRVFGKNLLANLVPFADDVKVQVEFNPATVKGYRLIGYENRALADEDFRNDAVDAGDVGPNSQFTVAYEIVLVDSAMTITEPDLKYGAGSQGSAYAGATSAQANELLTATLRWHAFDDGNVHELETVVSEGDATTAPSESWKLAASVIEFGMIARDSQYAIGLTCDDALNLLNGVERTDEVDSFESMVKTYGRTDTRNTRAER